jgi:hypothetical protein
MSKYERLGGSQGLLGLRFVKAGAAAVERFIATGFGSRGGPNKVSNKLRARPSAYHLFN